MSRNTVNEKDYYQVLGVDKAATEQEIKQAYRKLAFQYHPDRNRGNPAATEKMKAINEAYATLSNPDKRREYDALREQYGAFAYDRFRQAHTSEDIFRGSDIDQVFEEFARTFGFRSSAEIFKEFYGPGFRSFEFHGPGMSARGFVFYGGRGKTTPRQVNSANQVEQLPEFPSAGILGRLIKGVFQKLTGLQFPEKGKDIKDVLALSPENARRGGEVQYRHRQAGEMKDLVVKVPAGIKDGQRIRLRGMGGPGKGGGPPGDLYLQVRIRIPLSQRIKNLLR